MAAVVGGVQQDRTFLPLEPVFDAVAEANRHNAMLDAQRQAVRKCWFDNRHPGNVYRTLLPLWRRTEALPGGYGLRAVESRGGEGVVFRMPADQKTMPGSLRSKWMVLSPCSVSWVFLRKTNILQTGSPARLYGISADVRTVRPIGSLSKDLPTEANTPL